MKAFSRSKLKVGNIIKPQGFPEGEIVTVEKCSLESFVDKQSKKHWPCYTVRTNAPRPFHKYLITDWGKDGLILWNKSKIKFAPKHSFLWIERSGLEEMENISSKSPNSFVYAMLMFILDKNIRKPNKLYCIERLRNNRIFRYEGFRIG